MPASEDLDVRGSRLLHEMFADLHYSDAVENTQRRLKKEYRSQKPVEKIVAYLSRLNDVVSSKDERVRERNVSFLKKRWYDSLVITPEDIPETYFENRKNMLRDRGMGDVEVNIERRHELGECAVGDQKASLDKWVDYFAFDDTAYPAWFKYWAMRSMPNLGSYKNGKFNKRSKKTVAPFAELNQEALVKTKENVMEKLQNKENVSGFARTYASELAQLIPTEESELQETEGEWVRYVKGDARNLIESLDGRSTEWCITGESTAVSYLRLGDIHVFYSLNDESKASVPRVAIRFEDQQIAEVRGIGDYQNLDNYITKVAKDKLNEFPDGEKYEKRSNDMKLLTDIYNKHVSQQFLTTEDLRFLYQIDSRIEGFGLGSDPRVEEITKNRDQGADARQIYNFDSRQTFYGNIKLHWLTNAKGLKLPKKINGNLDLNNLEGAEDLKLPETINGNLYLNNLLDAEGLKFPETINGNLDLYSLKSAKGLKLPKKINGNLDLNNLGRGEKLKLFVYRHGERFFSSIFSSTLNRNYCASYNRKVIT